MAAGLTSCWGMSRGWQLLAALLVLCLVVNLLVVYRGQAFLRHSPQPQPTASSSPRLQFLQALASLESARVVSPGDTAAPPSVPPSAATPVKKEAQGKKTLVGEGGQKGPQEDGHSPSATRTVNGTQGEPLRNPHNFGYILNEPNKCQPAPELVVVVCTSVGNLKERQAVRETWGNLTLYLPTRVVLVFLIGSTTSPDAQALVVEESKTHHDIIQEDFIDSYRNLTLKSVAMLRWVATCCAGAKFALKSDDDMYINVPNLLTSLRAQKESKFLLGSLFVGARPMKDKKSKWYTPPEQFSEKVYPKYVSGTAYAMSTIAAPDLFEASLHLPFFWLEDVFITGLCARKAGIPRINDGKFTYTKREATGCAFRGAISGHRNSVAEIRKIHSELMSPSLNCH